MGRDGGSGKVYRISGNVRRKGRMDGKGEEEEKKQIGQTDKRTGENAAAASAEEEEQ